ncbi:MAG: peroxiredoxin [Planctomycetota bacterium]|nr:MAG: peroxiredoxin [Planctomycetota bacterium]
MPLALVVVCLAWSSARSDESKPVALKPGDKAPKFAGQTDEGKPWKSEDHVGEKILVVYFYPKDMTSGCTKQACSYRDLKEEFADQEVEVLGVSGDTVESHRQFKEKEDLNFTLLADPEGKIAKAFGVKLLAASPNIVTQRWTFVIDQDGEIAYKNEKVDAAKDAEEVLKVVEELQAKKS